jgi:hypothetical protein
MIGRSEGCCGRRRGIPHCAGSVRNDGVSCWHIDWRIDPGGTQAPPFADSEWDAQEKNEWWWYG